MKRVFVALFLLIGSLSVSLAPSAHALSSNPKHFISADNTFYAYVKGGESIGATFTRVNQDEPFDTPREDITITIDGPGAAQQKCVIPKNVAIGEGCRFATQTAQTSGVWRVQFAVPATAKTYYEVSPVVRWAKNLFSWNITVSAGNSEQHGRIWTEQYAIRQPADESFIGDFLAYYISEDGYIYKSNYLGYNGQISTLSADAIGVRGGDSCVSAYQSTDVSNAKFSPALGACGSGYKLFFEEPAGDLPEEATKWDDKKDWIRPNISRPVISELHFESDKSADQQSGTISFFLRNFIGQYQIKIDTNNDGDFNGQDDVVLNQQMKRLSDGLQRIHFSGTDKTGQIIATSQTVGIKVEITKVAEIHLVAADVEGRKGLELIRLNGDNAPTTRMCWNDTELAELAPTRTTKVVDGRDCPDSTGGVHGWAYSGDSWGNARYIDDWIYASAKLEGSNQILYPDTTEQAQMASRMNILPLIIGIGLGFMVIVAAIVLFIIRRRKKQAGVPPPLQPVPTPPQGQQPVYREDDPPERPRL